MNPSHDMHINLLKNEEEASQRQLMQNKGP